MAAGAVPVCMCGGSEQTIPAAEEDLPARLREVTHGYLADLVIVCTGAATALAQALKSVERGGTILIFAALISSIFAPLVFLGGFYPAILGMALWGIGMGAQESIMRAAIANMIPVNRRGSAYGVFNAGYGLFWFLGSALMGIFYDISIPALVAFSIITQLASIPFFMMVKRSA